MAVRSTEHVIATNRAGPRGSFAALVWPVSLSSALNGSLCDRRAGWGKDFGEPQKRDCCGFREADGAVHQMGVWGANKLVDL